MLWASQDGLRSVPALPVKVVDTVGAGDAFNAGLAVGLAEGQPMLDAIALGVTAASLSTQTRETIDSYAPGPKSTGMPAKCWRRAGSHTEVNPRCAMNIEFLTGLLIVVLAGALAGHVHPAHDAHPQVGLGTNWPAFCCWECWCSIGSWPPG